jgi:hypothetical protein
MLRQRQIRAASLVRYLAAPFEIYVAVQPLPILIAIIAIPQPSTDRALISGPADRPLLPYLQPVGWRNVPRLVRLLTEYIDVGRPVFRDPSARNPSAAPHAVRGELAPPPRPGVCASNHLHRGMASISGLVTLVSTD